MFTSLRARLWLSYAFVISIALMLVAIVLLVFLIRNPIALRQTQERLKTAQDLIVAAPQEYFDDPISMGDIANSYDVRVIVFNSSRDLVSDTRPNDPKIPFPRRNWLGRLSQTAVDAKGGIWLFTFKRLSKDQILVVASPRPRVPVMNIFADELLLPLIEGGVIAFLFSLVLSFALARWVADPLQEVVVAARNYPSGEMKSVVPRGPNEVQKLAQAFNSMVARVESSQRSQKDFVANVSHELKTPLTSVQGFAQAILDDTADTPEARRQAAQIIYDEAGRMHRMALDLLDLARLEAGTADLKMSPVDLGVLLHGVADKFIPQSQKAEIGLKVDVPVNLPSLVGDGDRLAQVFTNLVDNALKFTQTNGQVILSAKVVGSEMEILVTDTGSGIPNEALPRLFDRFYQVDASRGGGERHGAGLGLAIVQEIVHAHGGRISVRSQVGYGTTFVIHLPLSQAITTVARKRK